MKPISTFINASLMAIILFTLAAIPARAAQTIIIDGNLNDAAWNKARALDAFKTVQYKTLRGVTLAGQKPQVETTGLIYTDANYLYLGFRCEEPMMDKLEARKLSRDGNVWTNDCIEVFIAPFENKHEFFQIAVDTAGQVYDAFKSGDKQDAGYDISVIAKTQKQQNGWTMEMAIPLSEVGLSNARDAMFNFGRERKTVNEFSTWHGDFGKPETWQKLPLSLDKRYDVDVRNWDFGALQYGENQLTLEFAPSTTAPVGVLLQTQENKMWTNKDRKVIQSVSGQVTRFSMPYLLEPENKPQGIRLVLERSGQPMFQATRRISLPANALVATLTLPYYFTYEDSAVVRLQNFISPGALKTSYIRLTVKDPQGKVVSSSDIHDLRPMMLAGFDISNWRDGVGSLTAELLSGNQTLSSRTIAIPKRSGPFSIGATTR